MKLEQWAQWAVATIIAAVTLTAGAFTTFKTKNDSDKEKTEVKSLILESKKDILREIDRLDKKIDNMKR